MRIYDLFQDARSLLCECFDSLFCCLNILFLHFTVFCFFLGQGEEVFRTGLQIQKPMGLIYGSTGSQLTPQSLYTILQ